MEYITLRLGSTDEVEQWYVRHNHKTINTVVTVPYAACIQLCPPEDGHLMLETCIVFMCVCV